MKVLRTFKDKTDGFKRYNKGDKYAHKNKERTADLVDKGFIEKPKEEKKPAPKKEKAKENE